MHPLIHANRHLTTLIVCDAGQTHVWRRTGPRKQGEYKTWPAHRPDLETAEAADYVKRARNKTSVK